MKLKDVQKLSVNLGIKADPRGEKKVRSHLKKHVHKQDSEMTENPYSDSRIVFGESERDVRKVLAGIDMQTAELLLADRLGDIDLVISHHPEGKALAELHDVMHMQAEVLEGYGVPINIAEGLLRDRVAEVTRNLHKANHNRAADTAKLLNMPFLCAHTTTDNLASDFVSKTVKKEKPATVRDILKALENIPEFAEAGKNGAGPMLFAGSYANKAGKIIVEYTGGTNGSNAVYEKLSALGIGTIIGMHMNEESRREAERNHINVVMTSHMSADSLGMNLFLDELEKKGVEIVPTSGLIRVSRNKIKGNKKH